MPIAEFVRDAAEAILARGLISAEQVHQHGLRARDLSASNRVALVEIGSGQSFVVKDLESSHDPAQGSPLVERDLYRRAADLPDASAVLPTLISAADGLMIIRGLTSYRRLDHHRRGGGPLGDEGAAALGRALARWHQAAASLAMPSAWPWILDLDGDRLPIVDEDPALLRVADGIERRPVLLAELRRLRADWSANTVIHGDVRFANILMGTTPGDVRLVDWETAGRGDPRWDVAGAIQEFLSYGLTPDDLAANHGLAAITALLDAYREVGDHWPWMSLRPFVVWRIILRVFQFESWEGDGSDLQRQHLELAETLAVVDESPFTDS